MPEIAHPRKQTKGQTHHLNQPDCQELSKYARHWINVKGKARPLMQKKGFYAHLCKCIH